MTDSINTKNLTGIPPGCGSYQDEGTATMTTQSSRRAILAGAATLPALAVPTAGASSLAQPSAAAVPVDPVFAAIEAHRAAHMQVMLKGEISIGLVSGTPEHDVAQAQTDAAYELRAQAEAELVGVVPTTEAGVFSLLKYVEDFCCERIRHPTKPTQWHSQVEFLDTTYVEDEIVDALNGDPCELPVLFWIMRNVRTALADLRTEAGLSAVQS